jgi:23S rRNA pseudouridine1911/1915/1917 synthase
VSNLQILLNDNDIVCAIKPSGVECETKFPELLKTQLNLEKLYCVHRLDTLTSGVMVYAKTQTSAAALSKQITENTFEKHYLAVVSGEITGDGTLEDELFFDRKKGKSFVSKTKKNSTKHAVLDYTGLGENGGFSLLKIKLHTGRTHQIRVQFSSRGHSLFGDGKYGSKQNGNLALFSHSIKFTHPTKHTNVHISAIPSVEEKGWNLFSSELKMLQN